VIDRLEFSGLWFLPEDPATKLPGTLKFNQEEGGSLILTGLFQNDVFDKNEYHKPVIILGSSTRNEEITLSNCYRIRRERDSTGFRVTYRIEKIFHGAHFFKEDDIKFKELECIFSYFHYWVDMSNITLKGGADLPLKEFVITYKQPAPFLIAELSDYKIWIEVFPKVPPLSRNIKKVTLDQDTFLKFEFSNDISLSDGLNKVWLVQRFLSLAINKPTYPLLISGKSEINKKVIDNIVFHPRIKLFYEYPGISIEEKTFSGHDCFFPFPGDRIGAFLSNWISKSELLNPVYILYFSVIYDPDMYVEEKFLNMVLALESYHRGTMNNITWPESEIDNLRNAIIGATPVKYRSWLKEKLLYINEPSLRRRLKDLCVKYSNCLEKWINDRDKFINDVVVTRNYLIHHDEKLIEQTVKDEKLSLLTFKLKQLVRICLLYEIGFDESSINQLITRSWQWGLF
jgi:hypothetical protein